MENRKLGRRSANLARVAAHPQARDVIDLSRIPSRPAARDWGLVDGRPLEYPMFRNDELGVCGITSLGHSQITQSANSGVEVAILDSEIVDGYSRLGGYVPGRPETDNGVVLLDVGIKLLGGEPLAGRKLLAMVAIDPKDDDMVAAAGEFFGGIWYGWDLPRAWQGADVWDAAPNGSRSDDWAPRSWGGHATASVSYSPTRDGLISWAEFHPFTPEARRIYAEEAYALIWDGLWTRLDGGLCPAGLDLQKLSDLMAAIKA
jgi:hypothetical protein